MIKLLGFEEIRNALISNFKKNKLHHGLLFSGKKGVGKASFALELAAEIILFSSINKAADLSKIQSGSHPDLLIIKKEEKKQSISIDEIRQINHFLSLTSAISNHKVIIIDCLDDLNSNSSNAILKMLEEPPNNVFLFLINHDQKKLLKTIKSRCQIIKVGSVKYDNFAIALRYNFSEITEEEIRILSTICDLSIGLSLETYKQDCLDLFQQIENLIITDNTKAIFVLAKKIAGSQNLWVIFEKMVTFYFYNKIVTEPVKENFTQNINKYFAIFDKINDLLIANKSLNLDKSQLVVNILHIMQNLAKS